MKEILYKGKKRNGGSWIFGSLIVLDADSDFWYIVPEHTHASTMSPAQIIGCSMEMVIPETVCQYTGMTDINGNKIFENDIVESYIEYDDFRNKREKGILRYTYGMYEIQIEEHEGKPVYTDFMAGIALSGCPFEIKVLGNIFDNPELI